MQRAMAELGIAPSQTVVISGIGCSSRMPYYMNTYGMHTIHGRGLAIATGLKVARPDLTVWNVTGDGDCLAIGGNHFIHAMRRNIDLNIILFNNKIYGLTKGQYSPTSDRGLVTKSSPWGTVEDPFCPAELCIGARGTFFARAIDGDIKNSVAAMKAAVGHKGASVVEMLCNCVIFADGIHKLVTDPAVRADKTILLEDGKPMIYGKNRDKGLVLDGMGLRAVTIGQDGYTEDDILVHDAHSDNMGMHMMLAEMKGPELPVALGIIRDVKDVTYDDGVRDQVKDVMVKSKIHSVDDLLRSGSTWEVE